MPFHGPGKELGRRIKIGIPGRLVGAPRLTMQTVSPQGRLGEVADVVCGGLTGTAAILCRLGQVGAETLRESLSDVNQEKAKAQKFPIQTLAGPECGRGRIRVRGVCVDPSAALPGGDPFLTRAGGVAVAGAFGMPAFSPLEEQVLTRRCPPRMVLGFDNLCYPKAVLPPRSQFRKWKRAPSPTLSRRDEAAITRAASAKDRVLGLAKKAGLFASKTRPASKGKSRGHQHLLAPAPQTLRVISEETN